MNTLKPEAPSQKPAVRRVPKLGDLPLPPKVTARGHFTKAYAQTYRAAEQLGETADELTEVSVDEALRLMTEAMCAMRAIKNIFRGNPTPGRGE